MSLALQCERIWVDTPLGVRHCHLWKPVDGKLSAVVCVIHGLGEHGGRYEEVAQYFGQSKWGTLAIDLAGHGLSPGWRGCVHSYEQLLEDTAAADRWLAEQYPGLPVILYGHSMGGNLVLNYLLRRVPHAAVAVASGSLLKPANPPSQSFIRAALVLAKVFPHFRLRAPVRAECLTQDLREQQVYRDDPLVHRRLSLRLGAALLESGHWALAHAQQLPIPTLIAHGSCDTLTCPRAAEEFARQSNSLCSLKLFHGLMHDIHREVSRSEVLDFFTQWIMQQIRSNPHTRRRFSASSAVFD